MDPNTNLAEQRRLDDWLNAFRFLADAAMRAEERP